MVDGGQGMPASAIASLPFMPILKLITCVVWIVLTVVVVFCGWGSAQPKSVRVRSASVAFRRSVVMVDLLFCFVDCLMSPKDPAIRPTGRVDRNRSARAGFAAARQPAQQLLLQSSM